jgi:hypothetical protein
MFRFLSILCVCELPVAVLAWAAIQTHSSGADNGVYWLLGFAAVVLGLLVVAAYHEPGQADKPARRSNRALLERRNL